MAKKKKAKAARPSGNTGNANMLRKDLIAAAIMKCKDAIAQGFYVEAIAICESLIADREESLLNEYLHNADNSYQPAGTLACEIEKQIADLHQFSYLEEAVGTKAEVNAGVQPINLNHVDSVRIWSKRRNDAVHELAKLDPNMAFTFEQKYEVLDKVAKMGIKTFRRLDNAIRKYRREKAKSAKAVQP